MLVEIVHPDLWWLLEVAVVAELEWLVAEGVAAESDVGLLKVVIALESKDLVQWEADYRSVVRTYYAADSTTS